MDPMETLVQVRHCDNSLLLVVDEEADRSEQAAAEQKALSTDAMTHHN